VLLPKTQATPEYCDPLREASETIPGLCSTGLHSHLVVVGSVPAFFRRLPFFKHALVSILVILYFFSVYDNAKIEYNLATGSSKFRFCGDWRTSVQLVNTSDGIIESSSMTQVNAGILIFKIGDECQSLIVQSRHPDHLPSIFWSGRQVFHKDSWKRNQSVC